MSYIQARCDAFESTLNPNKHVFSFSKYVFALANEIISVVHTGLKSLNVGIVKLIFLYLLLNQTLQFYHYKSISYQLYFLKHIY